MEVVETALDGVVLIKPKIFGDSRGYFSETYNKNELEEAGIRADFIQDNESMSRYGVVRGLHYQKAPYTQAKLVRVIQGSVLDVVVDIRIGSPTFGQYVAVELSCENKLQMFVPRGFAHGFAVISDKVIFAYKCDNVYMPSHECGVAFDDPALSIDWCVDAEKMILSDKDQKNPLLADAELFDFCTKDYLA